MINRLMNVLVEGYGSMGVRHAATAMSLGHAVAVVDRDTERLRLATEAGAVFVSDDAKAALGSWGVDAAVIATPVAARTRWP